MKLCCLTIVPNICIKTNSPSSYPLVMECQSEANGCIIAPLQASLILKWGLLNKTRGNSCHCQWTMSARSCSFKKLNYLNFQKQILTNPKSKSRSKQTTGFSLKSQFPTVQPANRPPPGKFQRRKLELYIQNKSC